MSKDTRTITILIVEDNIGDFVLIEDFLLEEFENLSFKHLKTFGEVKEELLVNQNFDIILLDLSLPDISGESLIDEILKYTGNIPVIVLTGYSDLTFSRKALAKGVSDYLLKDELSPSLLYKSINYSIERNIFSAKIKDSEKNYRQLFQFSPEPMWLFDLETNKFIDVNNAAINHYGYSKQEFLEMTIFDIRPEREAANVKKIIDDASYQYGVNEAVYFGDYLHKKKNGEEFLVEIHSTIIDYKDKKARIGLARDVTEKRKEEERLKLLESVITNSTESVVILEPEKSTERGRKILYVNEAFTSITGYTSEQAIGNTLNMLFGTETCKKGVEDMIENMKQWKVTQIELVNYKKNGETFWANTSMVPVPNKKGGYSHWVAISRDVTEQKKYESDLKQSVTDKEILLSEIHHRVKNNLAVVSGMMQLQIIEEENDEVVRRLYDSVFRIQTMATIHELLYESSSFSKLYFSEIIKKLVKSIHDALHQNKEIEFKYDITPVELNINQAIPSSLIVNEVITNIYKHAFRGKKAGLISINVSEFQEKVFIKVYDDGVGLPDGFDPNVSGSLGTNIIRTLSGQLHANFDLTSKNGGTTFTLEFAKSEIRGMGNALL